MRRGRSRAFAGGTAADVEGGLELQRSIERMLARIRILVLALVVALVGVLPDDYPGHHAAAAWAIVGVLAAGTAALYRIARRRLELPALRILGLATLLFDSAIIFALVFVYSFQQGVPVRAFVYLAVLEAALRYGLWGGVALTAASAPLLAAVEWYRSDHYAPHAYSWNAVYLPTAVALVFGIAVGRLVENLRRQAASAQERLGEAVTLRDELGRRADLLDAANRCARALSSSLELEPAFTSFVRELQGLVPFDRAALVLADGGAMRVMAAAGLGVEAHLQPGTPLPAGALVEEVVERGDAVYRRHLDGRVYPEEAELIAAGLRSRVVAPLLHGPRTIGMLSVLREAPDAFSRDEIELVTLLGRLVATAVQNIRNYEGEHRTVAELRRLSALRADFVSLVSHELRSPMAAVIGSARTLQARWGELSAEQREAFLSLIAEETSRLATLVADVLDTSRMEAGTFTYRFSDVDLAELVRESAVVAEAGQDEVQVHATLPAGLPAVRGDRERLKQVLANLLDNAVKYSPAGAVVEVVCAAADRGVRVDVRDDGPGIEPDHQAMIFEKFGRAHDGHAKPGTGLGLFIARSIVEAHGGSLEVRSAPGHGSTFTIELPG